MTAAPEDRSAYVASLFNRVGDFSPEGASAMRDIGLGLLANAPRVLNEATKLMEQIRLLQGIDERDRNQVLDLVFSVIESSNSIQADYELLYEIASYRLAHGKGFDATRNALKGSSNNPKVVAMRAIEAAWDASGRPKVGDFAKEQARSHQLRGIDLTEKGIRNALKKHAKRGSSN